LRLTAGVLCLAIGSEDEFPVLELVCCSGAALSLLIHCLSCAAPLLVALLWLLCCGPVVRLSGTIIVVDQDTLRFAIIVFSNWGVWNVSQDNFGFGTVCSYLFDGIACGCGIA